MDCADRAALWRLASGKLDPEARAELEEHLAACEECRQELESVRTSQQLFAAADEFQPSRGDVSSAARVEARPQNVRKYGGLQGAVVGVAGLGALVLAFAGLFGGGRVEPAPAPRRSPAVESTPAPKSPPAAPRLAPTAPPEPAPAAPAAAPEGEPVKPAPLPAEELLLRAAEDAASRGDCLAFVPGLLAHALPAERAESRERARIFVARCYLEKGRRAEADVEFRRYLGEFPTGRFAAEARRSVAH